MSDHEDMGARLARGLHEEAESVRPDPALQSILTRTRKAPARQSRWGWWPVVGAALATGGLVAAVAFVALDGDPAVEPPVAAAPTSPVTVFFTNPDGKLVSESVEAADTGDPGLDAVNALLAATPADPDYSNSWCCDAELVSVTHAAGEIDVVLARETSGASSGIGDGRGQGQQMLYTVQAALDSTDPVRVTTGDAEAMATTDPYARALVQIESPTQGDTLSSPMTVSGQSATFEANVSWRIKQDGQIVKDGFTTSEGANGVFGPFEFDVNLPPGEYTVEAFEYSAENGKVVNLDSKDFTVE